MIRDGDRRGSENMARDHALALGARSSEAVLRLYGWTRPTVSFGRNEPARGLYAEAVAHGRGVDFVRRPTGGRAVLHADELTYAVVVPDTALGGARATYRRINEALAAALTSLGADVTVTGDGRALRPDAGPCFREPASGEVVARGLKLVGSAQARIGGALLQHGSILVSGDQSELEELRAPVGWGGGAEGGAVGATISVRTDGEPGRRGGRDLGGAVGSRARAGHARLSDLVAGVDRHALEDALAAVLPGRLGGKAHGRSAEAERGEGLRTRERIEARRLEAERYGSDTWTWKR